MRYTVRIRETAYRELDIEIEAKSPSEAEQIVLERYRNGSVDFTGTEFNGHADIEAINH